MVDQICDIVEETIGEIYPSARPGVLGSAIIGGRVTDLLDAEGIAAEAAPLPEVALARLAKVLAEGAGAGLPLEVQP